MAMCSLVLLSRKTDLVYISDMEDALDELLQFLSSNRLDVRVIAVNELLGLTSSSEVVQLIRTREDVISNLVHICCSAESVVQKPAIQSVVNLSTDDVLARKLLLENESSLVDTLLHLLVSEDAISDLTEVSCMALSNLSREKDNCQCIWKVICTKDTISVETLISLLSNESSSLHHVAPFLCNLSQLEQFRSEILKDTTIIKRILPFINYLKSDIRRRGVVGLLRNCCFDTAYHDLLMSDEVDIVVALTYPLAGPEEFSEDEMEQLPLDLQYLGEDKQREVCADIRQMLIEAINQLCAKKEGRLAIREKNIYYMLRELHKWEQVSDVINACENLVDILIGDEPEAGMQNLREVHIPEDVQKKFDEAVAAPAT